jgi:hypothetical protein
MKSKRIKLAGHMASMGQKKNGCKAVVEKPE